MKEKEFSNLEWKKKELFMLKRKKETNKQTNTEWKKEK